MTLADKIRSMTNEELAKWFAKYMLCKECKGNFVNGCDMEDCEKYALIFLGEEVDDK